MFSRTKHDEDLAKQKSIHSFFFKFDGNAPLENQKLENSLNADLEMANKDQNKVLQASKNQEKVLNIQEQNDNIKLKENQSTSSSIVSIYSNKIGTNLPNLNRSFETPNGDSYLESTPNIQKVKTSLWLIM